MPSAITIFNPRHPNATTGTATGGATLDRQNIDALLRGDFDPYEINMQSAENAIGGGTAGSGFAQAGRYKLLDSEKLQRKAMGNQMLNPYLEREHQSAMQAAQTRDRMAEIAKEGELAMERLRLSEMGQGERLSAQLKAQLEQQALMGNQAMERLRVQETGETARQRTGIGGTLLNTLLSQYGRGVSGGGGTSGTSARPTISTHGFSGSGSANAWAGSLAGTGYMDPSAAGGYMMGSGSGRPAQSVGGGGSGGINNSIVSRILNQFGIRL